MEVIYAKVVTIDLEQPNSRRPIAMLMGENFTGFLQVKHTADQLRYETEDGLGVRLGSEPRIEISLPFL